MGPMTHSEVVNDQIADFIKSQTTFIESQETLIAA
jgi:hypothetical protein